MKNIINEFGQVKGEHVGKFQSDDLWTPEEVAQWKKNWMSDARPEPEVKQISFCPNCGNEIKRESIQQRIMNNGDKLI